MVSVHVPTSFSSSSLPPRGAQAADNTQPHYAIWSVLLQSPFLSRSSSTFYCSVLYHVFFSSVLYRLFFTICSSGVLYHVFFCSVLYHVFFSSVLYHLFFRSSLPCVLYHVFFCSVPYHVFFSSVLYLSLIHI